MKKIDFLKILDREGLLIPLIMIMIRSFKSIIFALIFLTVRTYQIKYLWYLE